MSTPGDKEVFNLYDDIREKLVNKGIPKKKLLLFMRRTQIYKKINYFQNSDKEK